MTNGGALAGIRVVEMASYVSGPYASMMLADFGAEVIKIEPPDTGDPFRGWGANDYSATFGSLNRNKKSITLDLKRPEDVRRARALVDKADVLIENYRKGVLQRLGFGYDELRSSNPKLIYCSISGFGDRGSYADRPGYDTVGQAMGGLLSLLTDMKDPKPMGISLSDHLAGLFACNGVLAALVARNASGKGQRVDTSLLESTVSFLAENAARYFEDGTVPSRATRTHLAQVFAFVAGDGRPFVIHLSSPKKFWQGLLRAVDRPAWEDEPRYQDRKARAGNYEQLHAALSVIFKENTREHWLARLAAEDVPSGPLYDLEEVFSDPQVKEMEMQVRVGHPRRGHVSLIRNGVRLSKTPLTLRHAAPVLGEHNADVLGES